MINNRELANTFTLIADLLEIKGENFYKTNAYRKAAENLLELSQEAHQIWEDGELQSIPGVGKAIADKIDELLRTGELEFLNRLTAEVPASLAEMVKIPDLGPKKVKLFWDELGITTVEELAEAAKAGKLADLPGMGEKSQARVLAGIEALGRRQTGRIPLGDAWGFGQSQLMFLRALPGVAAAEMAGSLRRMRDTIGDLDILVAAEDSEPVMEAFSSQPNISHIEGRGPTKTSVEFSNGLRAQVWVHPPQRFGTALQYATGSKDHNVRVREQALKKGFSLSEHALTREDGTELLCASEEEVYQAVGLPFIPPELREDRGEVQAGLAGTLPRLIKVANILSDLHTHSTWSDGRGSIREMAEAAIARGRKMLAVTDHSQSLGIGNGLSIERLMAQKEEINQLRQEFQGQITLLHGTEMEIKADGTLDYPDEILAQLDIVVASLHVAMRQPREQVTERMLTAIRNPHVDIIGHPTNRLIPDRAGADLDMEVIFQAAAEHGTALEINANPQRLDLNDIHARRAIELGVLLAVDTDAHAPEHFDFLPFGVATARRAWAAKENVINTWPVEKLLGWLENRPHP
ncbi:MAG: DNA polymerase/3'-5' exonuclease PolX [Anaerolineales bacterium]|nr:DNA polymerase/3'-5' exonuclease PolX [Anaerolineales bacterium]